MESLTLYCHGSRQIFIQKSCGTGMVYDSHPRPVTRSVIQGNVPESLLFLLYFSDVYNFIREHVSFLFADNIKIVYTFWANALDLTRPK